MSDQDSNKKGKPLIIISVAVAILFGLSFIPWGKLTNKQLKNYNLLSDIFPSDEETVGGNEYLDPELLAAMQEETATTDTVAAGVAENAMQANDSESHLPPTQTAPVERNAADLPSRIDGEMVLEDYTFDSEGLARFKNRLQQSSSRPVRIAVIGDSYIEGDIFTQDIRDRLQNRFGGRGVGYMPAHSIVEGFRNTVRHNDSGWTEKGIRHSGCRYSDLQGEYHVGTSGATVKYEGKGNGRLRGWNTSRLLFVAPADGTITFVTDTGETVFDVTASDEVQQLLLAGETSKLQIKSDIDGLVFLGAWLEDGVGVTVDCMSLRGYSGITHRNIDPALSAQMRRYVDYDLIIMEYGINALSSEQSDYRSYSRMMAAAATRIKECYPNADIIMLGIGDRGQKIGGVVHSIPTSAHMVAAQRKAAQNAGVLFWDTREAMGGEDAVVQWRNDNLVNADYIHLNSRGGSKLADLFVNSLMLTMGM